MVETVGEIDKYFFTGIYGLDSDLVQLKNIEVYKNISRHCFS